MADLVERLKQTTLEMANRCSVPMELWDRHSNAALEAAATITALRDRVAEVERERDALHAGLSDLVNCQSALPRAAMREAAAEILRNAGLKTIKQGGDRSPLVAELAAYRSRATAAEAAIARLRDEVIEALSKARVYVEMIVTDQFADTGTDKQDLAEIDAALRALNRDTHHETR